MEKLTHWSHPSGGESSSGISTTTAREPPEGAGPCAASVDATARTTTGARPPSTAGATDCASTTPAAAGCASTTAGAADCTSATTGARRSSTAAVLAPARGALDERCRVGTDASALNTLAGARGGTIGTTLHKHKQIIRTPGCRKPNPAEEQAPYLEEEKARFLFLEASVDDV
jgi:hypothetical protein